MDVCHCGPSSPFFKRKKEMCLFIHSSVSVIFLLSIFVGLFVPLETTFEGWKHNEKKNKNGNVENREKTMVKNCCGERYCLVSKNELKNKAVSINPVCRDVQKKKRFFFFCTAPVCGPFIVLTFCH